jgi:hypothetical protein
VRRSIRRRFFVVALASIAAPAIASTAWGAAFDPASSDWEGCSELVEVAKNQLGPSRVSVVDELDYEALGATDGLLLLHPQGTYDVDELTAFMKLGGRVAVADDFGDGDRLLDRFKIQRLAPPSDPLQTLRGNPQLPIAAPASSHPIVAEVAQVVLNHPTVVKHADLSPLLRIPRSGGDQGPEVALAGQVGEGRLVAIGDPSILINSMLRFPGNRAFARNLAEYLLEGAGEHKRQAHLYVVHDRFHEKGSRAGGFSGGVRERLRALDSAIESVRREGFGGVAARLLALGVMLGATIWTLVRAAQRSGIPRPRFAASDPAAPRLRAGVDDPRLRPLVAEAPRAWWKRRALSPVGLVTMLDAVDTAVAQRVDLAAESREQALLKLARESGLDGAESARVVASIGRLRELASAFQAGSASAPRARTVDLVRLERLLRAHARSLGRAIDAAPEPT